MMELTIHVYHHFEADDPKVLQRLDQLSTDTSAGFAAVGKAVASSHTSLRRLLMGVKQDIDAAMSQIDQYTNAVADRIAALAQKVQDMLDNGVNPTDAAAVVSGLQAEVAKLQALASDPNAPIPAPEPPAPPTNG